MSQNSAGDAANIALKPHANNGLHAYPSTFAPTVQRFPPITPDQILARLGKYRKSGNGWRAGCPAHGGTDFNLSIRTGTEGRALLKCHSHACSYESILRAVGLWEDYMSTLPTPRATPKGSRSTAAQQPRVKPSRVSALATSDTTTPIKPHIVTWGAEIVYSYRDEDGTTLYEKVRQPVLLSDGTRDKKFFQRLPGRTAKEGLGNVRRVPYALPELRAALDAQPAGQVLLPEGEKDRDNLAALGFTATSLKDWQEEFTAYLTPQCHAVMLVDHDRHGHDQAREVARTIAPRVASVRWLDLYDGAPLPEGGGRDVSDWLADGHTADELRQAIKHAPLWHDATAPAESAPTTPPTDPSPPMTLRFTTLNDLLAEPEEDIAWVWQDTLPSGGFSICAAKPKVGKSTLARNLAVAIINGTEFLGRAVTAGRVLYLCLEEKRAEVKKHFQRMGARSANLLIHTGSAGPQALPELTAAIAEWEPVLVILDPLSRFVRLSDFNDYGKATLALEPLIDLARRSGCHILAVHHDGKSERDGGDSLLGSTAFFGAVDTLIKMKRREVGRTVETVQRYGQDLPEIVAHLDAVTGIVTAQGNVQSLKLDERQQAVMGCLADGAELTEAALREHIGKENGLTAKALRELFKNKQIERTGKGGKNDPYRYHKPATPSLEKGQNFKDF